LVYGDANYGARYTEAIAALQLEDLHQAARTFLDPQRANIALLLPKDAPLPDRDTVLTWVQETADVVAGAPALHLSTDSAAQVSVVDLPGNRKLIVQTDRKAPLVSIRTILDGGQRAESRGQEGLARLCAAVWDRGTDLRSAAEIERDIDRLGASFGTTSDRDTLQLSARYLKETFADGLELYFDVLAHPTFPEAEVERERADQLRDLESLKENRFAFALQHFLDAFYAPHPYGNLTLGRYDSVATVTREQVLTFYRLLLQAPQAVFAVVGDIAVEDVLALFQRFAPVTLFDATPTVPFTTPALPERTEPLERVITMAGQQTHIVWGFPTVTLHHPDRYPLRVLETILGGMGGRLFMELRDKKSLAYAVTTIDAYAVDAGFLALYIGCSPEKEAEARREFTRVVHEVQDAGVTPEELERAKTYLEGGLDIGLQGTSQRTAVYGLGMLQHGKWNAFQTYLQAIQNVTGAEVQRVAQTYLDPARAVRMILRAEATGA
jgi:zinc protease